MYTYNKLIISRRIFNRVGVISAPREALKSTFPTAGGATETWSQLSLSLPASGDNTSFTWGAQVSFWYKEENTKRSCLGCLAETPEGGGGVLQVRTLSLRKIMFSEEKEKKTHERLSGWWRDVRERVTAFSLTCNDGGGLTSDLVLVHILPIVQLPLH